MLDPLTTGDNRLPNDGATYELVESFDIDDGSLDGLTPNHGFVLGVEYQCAYRLLAERKVRDFDEMVHRLNVERLTKLAERKGWVVTTTSSVDPAWAMMRFVQARADGAQGAREGEME